METLDGDFSNEIEFNAEIKSYLLEMSKWTKFLAIVGFVFFGFSVIGLLFSGSLLSSFGVGGMVSITTGLILLLVFLPVLFLWRFSTGVKEALNIKQQGAMNEAFKNLKSFFKFYGIFTLICLVIYFLFFLFALIAGLNFGY